MTATEYHVVTAGKAMIQVSRLLSAYRGEQRAVASQPDGEPAACVCWMVGGIHDRTESVGAGRKTMSG